MVYRLYKLKEKLRYRFKARHNKGHGIHSPYLYRFVNSILQEKYPYYCFEQIQNLVSVGSHQFRKDTHCGQILFRIIQNARYTNLLEIGADSGLETQYMAMANPDARCACVLRSAEPDLKLQERFRFKGLNQIETHLLKEGDSLETLINGFEKLDLVYFNQGLPSHRLLEIFMLCLGKKNRSSIFVIKNIHQNPELKKIWKIVRNNEQVQVSMDVYDLGILLFNPELEKRNYIFRTKKGAL